MWFLLVLNGIIPFVMVLVACLLKRYPAANMPAKNGYYMRLGYGYNTPSARRSQAHWDYAQSIAPDIFLSLGKTLAAAEILFSAAMFLLHAPVYAALIIGECMGFGFLFFGFHKTDRMIRQHFAGQ